MSTAGPFPNQLAPQPAGRRYPDEHRRAVPKGEYRNAQHGGCLRCTSPSVVLSHPYHLRRMPQRGDHAAGHGMHALAEFGLHLDVQRAGRALRVQHEPVARNRPGVAHLDPCRIQARPGPASAAATATLTSFGNARAASRTEPAKRGPAGAGPGSNSIVSPSVVPGAAAAAATPSSPAKAPGRMRRRWPHDLPVLSSRCSRASSAKAAPLVVHRSAWRSTCSPTFASTPGPATSTTSSDRVGAGTGEHAARCR